jgi:hypothetical protein
MGSGTWSSATYGTRSAHREATGADPFAYSATVHSTGRWEVHPSLDPKGMKVRESRDSGEHPRSVPIAVLFDVTGSMHHIPRQLQGNLPELLGLLLRKGYVEHPQITFGAIGDATCDHVPLQIGQFESDNRMDDCLERIVLEGGGGGQLTESYELGLYVMARHTVTDAWEKRGQRGYLFIVGDEMPYGRVDPGIVRRVIGDELHEALTTEAIVREVQERWDTYFILPRSAMHGDDPNVLDCWRRLLGQNVLHLDDINAVCETIALTVGLGEGTVGLSEAAGHLAEFGASSTAIAAATTAVGAVAERTSVATVATGELDGISAGQAAQRL